MIQESLFDIRSISNEYCLLNHKYDYIFTDIFSISKNHIGAKHWHLIFFILFFINSQN